MKWWTVAAWVWLAGAVVSAAPAAAQQQEGGLYIAGAGFDFRVAVERGIAQNQGGTRFFVLAVPPASAALSQLANDELVAIRNRATAAGAVFVVCQRDIDAGLVTVNDLVPGVVVARGWPPPGSNELPHGARYFPNEDSANLPASNEALRRLRSTCSS
jgi:hypothetical protein